MKRHLPFFLCVIVLWFVAGGRTFAPPQGLTPPVGETPHAPSKGRSGESRGMRWLAVSTPTFQKWFAAGRKYLERKEWEQAILAFRKALRERPLSEEAHFLAGVSYERRGREGLPGDATNWDELAENEYRAAVALGDYLPACYNLGILLTRLEREDEARKEFEHILLTKPNSALGSRARQALDRNIQKEYLPRLLSQRFPEETEPFAQESETP